MDRIDDNGWQVDAWLADDWAAVDPEYPRLLALLNKRRAGQSWHKHATFRDHLVGVYRMLKLWRQDRETCLCGLFHSVYSNEYVDLALFDPHEGRDVLANEIGADVERTIHRFCTIPRTAFVLALLDERTDCREGITLDRNGETFELSPREVALFLVVTLADLVEQWYSWQEDTMASYPHTGRLDAQPNWAVTLWPGPFRPGSSALSLASRLARHLRGLAEPVPPIFAQCTAHLDSADEAAAAALYWQVATLQMPLVDREHARGMLARAVEMNPWVGEPHLMLAQIDLVSGRFEDAEQHAGRGLALLRDWGIQWDKRVSWEGWVVWASMLAQRARLREWPGTLRDFNNLGLVTRDA
ncbi:DUF6817 domain-containing protein [Burkholderia ubonensis]|uniref:DUF6817 domain-containing protein n=1 Tax=Burkholderia ubonensis TaxID=101571 RepID=UPI000753B7BB|nr:hypothetical protein [Burkholderia ubonensis]AOI68038.1 hypothetical protein WI31_00050 [Burkholderia ubonensis]KUZ23003.1 hypothetical protein WI29_12400 [Burkholderia ubonensis]KUZ24751.1 hypothetical protein WI32_33570 [Burkholderia ubonensis]KUZ36683.1 hypothetical protein WI30_08150 [Burkholderia ubonensis]KUZ51465.1 hypothetical protein WI33_12905 [Burkholderia ubonensis]